MRTLTEQDLELLTALVARWTRKAVREELDRRFGKIGPDQDVNETVREVDDEPKKGCRSRTCGSPSD